MIVSYSRNAHGEALINYANYSKTYTPNEIHNETKLKRTTIFRHPHKKRKEPNHCGYLPQTYGYPTILPSIATTAKTIKSARYALAHRIYTIITHKILRKSRFKELYTTLYQRGYPKALIDKGFKLTEKYHKKNYETRKSIATKNPKHTSQPTKKIIQNYSQK